MFHFDGMRTWLDGQALVDDQGNRQPVSWFCTFLRYGEEGLRPVVFEDERYRHATVRIDLDEHGNVTGVEFVKHSDRMTASELSRFPWLRFTTAAIHAREAALAPPLPEDGPQLTPAEAKSMFDISRAVKETTRQTKRPGRRGHPPEFYESVARRYIKLVAEGNRNPVQLLVEEEIERENYVSRDTVSTWIKTCRSKGLIPVGQPRGAKISTQQPTEEKP